MKVTLRKAHRLVKELQSKLTVRFESKELHHTSVSSVIRDTVKQVNDDSAAVVERVLSTLDVVYDIRESLQKANSEVHDGISVDALLNQKAIIESKMRTLSLFSSPSKQTNEEVVSHIARSVDDNHESTSEYRDVYTRVTGVSPLQHNEFNKQYVALKKEQETVSDKLAYLNNKLEIEINEEFVTLLEELQVL